MLPTGPNSIISQIGTKVGILFAMASRHVIFYNISLNPRLNQVIRLASRICNFIRLG